MTKKKDTKYSRESQLDRNVVNDWEPSVGRLTDIVDWALDIAQQLAGDDDEDLRAIENVREFLHGWLEGRRAEVPLADLLTTLAILFAAIELDRESISLLAPLRTMRDTPSVLPAMLRCPGATRNEPPAVVIRRFPGRRNASAPFNQFAA